MANPWDATFDQVRVIRSPGCVYEPTPQVTPAMLDEAEQQLGTRFPESYRAFITRFGSGELEGRVNVCRPVAEHGGLVELTRDYRAFLEEWAEYVADPLWIRRLVFFGSDGLGDAYGWHPDEITSSNPHECRFYHAQRAPLQPLHVAGGTFAEFLYWSTAEARAGDGEATDLAVGFRFAPDVLRMRAKPKHSDVQKWLHFNNRTARLIAKSIRDEGRVEAFPILADALQEAGCTNADLLDSCRTGDPDIDGRWVLQVLLGKG